MENLLALMVSLEPLKHGCVLNLRGAACQGQCQGYTAPMHSAKLLVERHPKPQAASRVATMPGTQVEGDKNEPKPGCRRCGLLETAIIIRTEPLCRYVVPSNMADMLVEILLWFQRLFCQICTHESN